MSTIPENLKYTPTHEWIRLEDGIATVGITDHAQAELTDIVYVELPEIGRALAAGDSCAVVESVKTASDLYSPLAGSVVEINTELEGSPELVNDSPYEDGWIFKIRTDSEPDWSGKLDASGYASEIGES